MRDLVLIEGHGPTRSVGHAVMPAAQCGQVVEVGRPAVVPVHDVVVVAPVDGSVATGKGAPAVSYRDGVALGDGCQAAGSAHVDGHPHLVGDDGPDVRVTPPDVGGSLGERGSVTVAGLMVVNDQCDLGTRGATRSGFGPLCDAEQFDQCFGSEGFAIGNVQGCSELVVAAVAPEQLVGFRIDRAADDQSVGGIE